MYIKQKNTNTYVDTTNYVGELASHPLIVDMPDKFEIVDTISDNPDWMISNYQGDPRKAPDYYLVRESVGKALVNEVSNDLLKKYKTGELTLIQVMGIEESLKEVISALGRGQFYTASYKLAISQGAPADMKATLTTTIQGLIQEHYA